MTTQLAERIRLEQTADSAAQWRETSISQTSISQTSINFNSILVLQSNFNQTSHCLVVQFIRIALHPRNNSNAKSICFLDQDLLNQDRWRRDRVGPHDCNALLYNPRKRP